MKTIQNMKFFKHIIYNIMPFLDLIINYNFRDCGITGAFQEQSSLKPITNQDNNDFQSRED
jgi:hypothetical protein